MAERRMFAKTIIDSDAFLDMPLSTQALYFHLAMRADDDGFINKPKMIMRMIGASQNELELLLAKRYLLSFDSGVVVIKHWRIHNYIQKDRYKKTVYLEEFEKLEIKENKSYTDKDLRVMNTECIHDGYNMDTECVQNGDTGKVRLGKSKVSIGKINIGENEDKCPDKYPPEIEIELEKEIDIAGKEETPTAELSAQKTKSLYKIIESIFLSKNNNSFDNYKKEGMAIKGIISKAEKRENPDVFIQELIEKFYDLTINGNDFWTGQPFLPSALNASGIFARVEKQIQTSEFIPTEPDYNNLEDYSEVIF